MIESNLDEENCIDIRNEKENKKLTLSFDSKPTSDHRSENNNDYSQTNKYDDFFLKKQSLSFFSPENTRNVNKYIYREREGKKSTRNCRIFILFID